MSGEMDALSTAGSISNSPDQPESDKRKEVGGGKKKDRMVFGGSFQHFHEPATGEGRKRGKKKITRKKKRKEKGGRRSPTIPP